MLGCQRHVDVFGDICQRAFVASFDGAHSEGHPHTEGAFTGTLVKVRGLRRNSGECQGNSCEYGLWVRFCHLSDVSGHFLCLFTFASPVLRQGD